MIDEVENKRALKFARQHDWGKKAVLIDGHIHGLIDNDGYSERTHEPIKATISAVRRFGRY